MLAHEQNVRLPTNIAIEGIVCIFFREYWHKSIPAKDGGKGGRKGIVDSLGTPEGGKPWRSPHGSMKLLISKGAPKLSFLLGHVGFLNERRP